MGHPLCLLISWIFLVNVIGQVNKAKAIKLMPLCLSLNRRTKLYAISCKKTTKSTKGVSYFIAKKLLSSSGCPLASPIQRTAGSAERSAFVNVMEKLTFKG